MSVLVKGIEMPKNCYDCPFIRASVAGDYYCVAGDGIEEDLNKLYERRMSDCPLVDSPEPHWIPVTEATPTEDDDYWATFEAETGRFVDWASWYQGRWVVWIEGSPAPLSNVIAWCKPIEPYKGVTE